MRRRPEKGNAPEGRSSEALDEANPLAKESNMSHSTQVAATRAITVPFHGADLYVVEHNGLPYTPMKPIVQAMGLDWGSQFRKVAANEARWGIVNLTIPSAGGEQAMTCLPVRKTAAWLTTIEPGKVKNPEVRARVIQYQNECDDVLWQYWNDGIAINPRAYSFQPGQTLSAEQATTLRMLLTENVKKLPKEKQASAMITGWSKLKAHFKTDYRHIPAGEFHEAVNILARHVADWEVVDDGPKAGTVNEIVADWVKKLEEPNGYPAFLFMPLWEAITRKIVGSNIGQAGSLNGSSVRRWVVTADPLSNGQPWQVKAMESDAYILPMERFHDAIDTRLTIKQEVLVKIASSCMRRLTYSMAGQHNLAVI